MQLRSLEIFCAVAEQRSFSRAAAAFDLTQSAVSQSIQQLEEAVGAVLIDRSKRPLILTDAGEVYFRGVRGVLRDYQELERQVRSRGTRLDGEVRIGTIYSVGLSYMPDATAEFSRRHEGVQVRLEYGHSERVVDMVQAGEVDFGLVSFPKNTKQIEHVVWQNEPMRLVCSKRHPLAAQTEVTAGDLTGVRMVGFSRSLLLRTEIDRLLIRAGIDVDFNIEFDNADSMVRAIEANGGIGFLPQSVVRRETAEGSLRMIACPAFHMTRPLGFIFRRSAKLSPASVEFVSLLLGRPLPIDSRGRLASANKTPTGGGLPATTPAGRRVSGQKTKSSDTKSQGHGTTSVVA